jgi:hypothetical protein
MHLRALIKSLEMKQFQPSEIHEFLAAADSYLKLPVDLIVIGGAAAALAYKATKTTTDIDTANRIQKELLHAFAAATKETGLVIPVSKAGVFDAPYSYEDRLQKYDQINLKVLRVYVPEQHDLALMKIVRGYENDTQTICEIHENLPFSFEILMQRFLTEMTHVIGNSKTIRMNFLQTIFAMFGEELADQAEELTKNWCQTISPTNHHKAPADDP